MVLKRIVVIIIIFYLNLIVSNGGLNTDPQGEESLPTVYVFKRGFSHFVRIRMILRAFLSQKFCGPIKWLPLSNLKYLGCTYVFHEFQTHTWENLFLKDMAFITQECSVLKS